MRLATPYEVLPAYFDAAFCDEVIACGEAAGLMTGKVRSDPEGNLRDSLVSWLPDSEPYHALHLRVGEVVRACNERLWHWELSGPESMQYTSYTAGQHYTWHADANPEPYPDGKRWAGQIRKISVSVLLSDPGDYEGGVFLIEDPKAIPTRADARVKRLGDGAPRGTAIVFPSFLHHKVETVTSGRRRSLVAWYLGPPYR